MTAPNMHVKASAVWKRVTGVHTRVGGAWKRVRRVWVRQGGAWKLALAEMQGFEVESAEPIAGAQMPLWNATLVKKGERNKIKVEAFPPEQLLVKRDWPTPLLAECPYVCRVVPVTLSELRQMGFKVEAEDLRASNASPTSDSFEQYRTGYPRDDESDDESLAVGRLRIEFVLADYDGDGIAERRVIYRLEQKILRNEETDHVQIATTSPVLNTHQWAGMVQSIRWLSPPCSAKAQMEATRISAKSMVGSHRRCFRPLGHFGFKKALTRLRSAWTLTDCHV